MERSGINLNKYMVSIGYCTRKEADDLIKAKRITINGKVAKAGSRITNEDRIKLDGQEIGGIIKIDQKKTYIVFNKPKGIVVSSNKNAKRNIVEYIAHEKQILPLGKMDKETEGIVILTDEHISKTKLKKFMSAEQEYFLTANQKISREFISAMEKGIIKNRKKYPRCRIKRLSKVDMVLRIRNADDLMVKTMCASQGVRVKRLMRTSIAGVSLGRLKPGKWKSLKGKDLDTLRNMIL